MNEARTLTEDRLRELAAMPVEELVRFEPAAAESEIRGPSGRRYRMKTYSFWDTEPFGSDLYTRVKVTGTGLRRFQRYYGVEVRAPDSDFASDAGREVDASPTWTEALTWTGFVGVVVVFPIALIVLGLLLLI